MSDPNTPNVDATTAESMANAHQNAGYPATAGDHDASGVTSDAPTAASTVDEIVAYLTAPDLADDQLQARADLVEQLENDRDGDNRKGVTAAIEQARAVS